MKNRRYQEFAVGQKGSGKVNLATGHLEFIHENTCSDANILPISVKHVYLSERVNQDSAFGRGFGLNLNQRLDRIVTEDGSRVVYELTDPSGNKHTFEEKFYFLRDGVRHERSRDQVVISQDGRLTHMDNGIEREIFTELKTESGLTIQTLLDGFKGSEKLEQRHEEVVRLEQEINGLERNKEEILFSNYKANPDVDLVIPESIRSAIINPTQVHIGSSPSTSITRSAILTPEDIGRLSIQQKQEFIILLYNQISELNQKGFHHSHRIVFDPNQSNHRQRFRYERQNDTFALNDYQGRVADFRATEAQFIGTDMPQPQEMDINTANDTERVNSERNNNHTRDSNRELNSMWAQQREAKFLNQEFANRQHALQQNIEVLNRSIEDERLPRLDELAKQDLKTINKRLAQARHQFTTLTRQLPVMYVTGASEGITLGFNENGDFVSVFDNHDNQVAIIYEEILNSPQTRTGRRATRIARVVDSEEKEITFEYSSRQADGRLIAIKDFQNKRTEFCYNDESGRSANFLRTIKYPNGEIFTLGYDSQDRLNQMRAPSKIGATLEFDGQNRVTRIADISAENKVLNVLSVASGVSATVLDERSRVTAHYRFDRNNDATAEWSEINETLRNFTLFDLQERYEFVLERKRTTITEIDSLVSGNGTRTRQNVATIQGEWKFIELDERGNKTAEYQSDRRHCNVTRSINTKFEYRNNKLVREIKSVSINQGNPREYTTTYEYDSKGKQIRIIDFEGMVDETVFDTNGNVVKSQGYHLSNPSAKMIDENELSENGKVLAQIDELGNRTELVYQENTNVVIGSVSSTGQKFSIGKNPHTGATSSLSASIDGKANKNLFGIEKEFLTHLISTNTEFEYFYDELGRPKKIKINGKDHVEYDFVETADQDITTTKFTNEEGYRTKADTLGRVREIDYLRGAGFVKFVSNKYEDDRHLDLITETTNHITGETTKFTYDDDANITRQDGCVNLRNTYNIDGQVTHADIQANGKSHEYKYSYMPNTQLRAVTLPTGKVEGMKYDEMGRTRKFNLATGSKEIHYLSSGERTSSHPVSEVTKIGNETTEHHYTYDASGNITEVREDGNLTARYQYDGLNRLVREDNADLGRSYTYRYDTNGNILGKVKHDFSLTESLENGTKISYQYSGDQLVSYNGEICEYDEIGNPTTYRNKQMSWSHIGNLESIENGRVTFDYDHEGIRTHKRTTSGTRSEFFYTGDRLLAETRSVIHLDQEIGGYITRSDTHITYLYGVDEITGLTVESAGEIKAYYYHKNIQGDILAIYDDQNQLVAEYTYDAWGNHIVKNHTSDNIGDFNTIRYRSYYYDTETNLYYLKTRYYDPQVGRFLNMDDINLLDELSENINGLNLYAYCLNNPISFSDPDGQCPVTAIVLVLKITAKIAIKALVKGAIKLGKTYGIKGGIKVGAKKAGGILKKGVVKGAKVVKAKKGQMISGAVNNGIWNGVGSVADGGCFIRGFASGAITGAIGGFGVIAGAVGAFGSSIVSDIIAGRGENLGAAFASGGTALAFGLAGDRLGRAMGNDLLSTVVSDVILTPKNFVADLFINRFLRL